MKYLFRATIGPVQSFIAQARKLQDLYAGSFLLSYLTKNMIRSAQEGGAVILYPQYEERRESYPNLFVATIECASPERLRAFAKGLKDGVRGQFRSMAERVMEHDRIRQEPSEAFYAQIDSLLEFHWSAEPYPDGADHRSVFVKTLRKMGAAKTTRMFGALSEPGGRKCDLSAEQNALFSRTKKAHLVADAYILPEIHEKFLREGETLGSVAFVKRCLGLVVEDFDDSFPSIEDIAHLTREANGYYALVRFDGDDMGALYSSDRIASERLEDFQKKLSRMAGEASEEMRKIVNLNNGNGVVIYAGGDDFLGVMNLDRVFSTLWRLRESFAKKIEIRADVGKVATFSAGIVIAHIKTPLGEVLDWARRAEHKAKECRRGDIAKDAYCLTILRRSGEITQYTHGFTLEGGRDGMSVLRDLVDTIVKNRVSVSFIYSLSREFEPLLKAPRAIHAAMFQSEAKRLLNHAELPEDSDKRAVVDGLCSCIDALVDKSGDKLTDVLNLLRSVAFITRQMGGER